MSALIIAGLLILHQGDTTAVTPDWPQWGGPGRDFTSPNGRLADSWPESGPHPLWSRTLGEGHSAIAVESAKLYTMSSRGEEETVTALDAATGKTIWEHRYPAPTAGMDYAAGKGPNSTPLVVGDRVFTVGALGMLHALDKRTGSVRWSHDLWKEFGGTKIDNGYSCSPLAYRDTLIVTVGGKGNGVMAFRQQDGSLVWKGQDFENTPSSPILIRVDGQDQLVVFMAKEIAGLDPTCGALLWRQPHETKWDLNVSTPVWGEGNLLFCSSAYNGGSRMLQLRRAGGKTTVRELWFNRRVRVHFGNVVRVGDLLCASSGDFGATQITGVDARSGKILWQTRFPKANLVWGERKLILLGEDGTLALATASPDGFQIRSKAKVLTAKAWTVPSLAGGVLYLRDRQKIMALDLRMEQRG